MTAASSARLAPLGVLVALLIGAGAFLRLHDFAFPDTLLFDERHFVENARNYLAGRPDWNDHPPLGKLIIAAAIRIGGDNPVAWRAPALLSGVLTVVLASVAVARLFRSNRAGAITAALLCADGFVSSYSRVALLDGPIGTCAAAALLLASCSPTVTTAILGGIVAGVATSLKFNGAGVMAPLLLALGLAPLSQRRRLVLALLLAATTIVVYVRLFGLGLSLVHHPSSIGDVFTATLGLARKHGSAIDMQNPWASSWPTWVLPWRPVPLGKFDELGATRVLNSLGNLAIWWSAVGLALFLLGTIAWRGVGTVARAQAPRSDGGASLRAQRWGDFVVDHARAVLLALATVGAFLAPWVLTRRDSYVYHFLPAYIVLVALLGAFVDWAGRRVPRLPVIFLSVVLIVTAFYAPVWSMLPISHRAMTHRLFLPSWR